MNTKIETIKKDFLFLVGLQQAKENKEFSQWDINLFKSSFYNKVNNLSAEDKTAIFEYMATVEDTFKAKGKLQKSVFTENHKIWKLKPENKNDLHQLTQSRNAVIDENNNVENKTTTPFHDIKEGDYVQVFTGTKKEDEGLVTFKYGKHYLNLDNDSKRKYNYSYSYYIVSKPETNNENPQTKNDKTEVKILSEEIYSPFEFNGTDEEWEEIVDKTWNPEKGRKLKELFNRYYEGTELKQIFDISTKDFDGLKLFIVFKDASNGVLDLSRNAELSDWRINGIAKEKLQQLQTLMLSWVDMDMAAPQIVASILSYKTTPKPETNNEKPQTRKAKVDLKNLIPADQYKTIKSTKSNEFEDVIEQLEQIVPRIPKLYATENQKAKDKIVYLHYFTPSSDWYVTELDTQNNEAFGYAILNKDTANAEWGYISIDELKELDGINGVNLDFYFAPVKFGELQLNWQREESKHYQQENIQPYEKIKEWVIDGGEFDINQFAEDDLRLFYQKTTFGFGNAIKLSDESVDRYNLLTKFRDVVLDKKIEDCQNHFGLGVEQLIENFRTILNYKQEIYFACKQATGKIYNKTFAANTATKESPKESTIKYAYNTGDKVVFLGAASKIINSEIVTPSTVNNGVQIWLTKNGYKPENEMLPAIVSAKKESLGQGYKMFRGLAGNNQHYKIEFEDGDTFSSSKDNRNDAILDAIRHRLYTVEDYPKTIFDAENIHPSKDIMDYLLKVVKEKASELTYDDFNMWWADTFILKQGNKTAGEDLIKMLNLPSNANILQIYNATTSPKPQTPNNLPFDETEEYLNNAAELGTMQRPQSVYIYDSLSNFESKSITAKLSLAQVAEYDENVQDNNHTGNVLLIAKATKNETLINAAKYVIAESEKLGYMDMELNKIRNKISDIIAIDRTQNEQQETKFQTLFQKSFGDYNYVVTFNDEENKIAINAFHKPTATSNFYPYFYQEFLDGNIDSELNKEILRKLEQQSSKFSLLLSKQKPYNQTTQQSTPNPKPQTIETIPQVLNSPLGARSKLQQHDINNQIRSLLNQKGTDHTKYSAEEIALLKLYEGSGGLAKQGERGARLLDQFFTPMDIIAKMWGLALQYGFSFPNSNILEPSVGSGRFISFVPPNSNANVVAYDVDETSYKLCKVLYPQHDIRFGSFEQMFFMGKRHIGLSGITQFYDLVITNPPYREYKSPYSPLGEKDATGAFTFEMYFIGRGVDVLKPGGLLIMIVPNSFLSNNNKYNDFKEKLAKKADLIDAYRLPNGVFGNTEVGTDIIVLKKK